MLENRAKGVQEALAKAPGIKVLGPFDVKVDPVENYTRWEQQYAANTDVVVASVRAYLNAINKSLAMREAETVAVPKRGM